MERDRVEGQNGKDGMRRPMDVSREEFESNFEAWIRKRKEARKQKEEENNNNKEEE